MINLAEQYRSAEALSKINHLLLLDDIWTERLAQTPSVYKHDLPVLQSLTEEMDYLFSSMHEDAEWAHSTFNLYLQSPEFTDSLPQLLSLVTGLTQNELQAKFTNAQALSDYLQKSIQQILDLIPAERQELKAKIYQLSQEQPTTGDMSNDAKCAAAGLGMIFALGLGPAFTTGGTGGMVGAAAIGRWAYANCF
jgi:hypothetical protein